MFVDGVILSGPLRDRLSPGPLGVRKYVPHKCFRGYTLFSTAFGSTEYVDIRFSVRLLVRPNTLST